ncbi:MAG: AMP-binding protein [Goleter apudmare HA4340-LM2]|jgi:thioesterase domain-containing protein|nr:AMP-binding protein [Goleter apudmare HA4340-LM2]
MTGERFIPNPFENSKFNRLYKTGDLVRYLPDGKLEFLGRIDHQFKLRGFRIELGEIEAVLSQHPGVQESIVVARVNELDEQQLIAYIVPYLEQTLTTSELHSLLKQKLPNYMIPSAFVILQSLPLLPNGKVNRRVLPASDGYRPQLEEDFVAARDTLEFQLAQIWTNLLNISPIGVKDNFFDIGGHSLLALRLMAQIQQQFGQTLLLSQLFEGATIEHLASTLRQQTSFQPQSPLVAIQPIGSKRPFFCVHPIGGNVLCYHHLANYLSPDQPFYGLQSLGLNGEGEPNTRIEDMASHYVKEILTIQPEGPYLLGGWSMGGLVAFEMAQQLQKQGQKVSLLALIDGRVPFSNIKPVNIDDYDAKILANFFQYLASSTGKNISISYDALQQLSADEQLNYILKQVQLTNLMPPDAGKEQLRCLLQVFKSNLQAMLNYTPHIYQNQMILFQASDRSSDALNESTQGWEQFSSKPVKIHTIPGDHYTMLSKPHVQVLAEQLMFYLDKAQSEEVLPSIH